MTGHGTGNAVSGLVGGHLVQAGHIHGGVTLHLPGSTGLPVRPRQIPPAGLAVDRDEVLADITGRLNAGTAGSTVLVLHGPGGIGKTTIAVTALHHHEHRLPDGLLWADLTHPLVADPVEVLGSFLRALGVAPDLVPDDERERLALWRSMTAPRQLGLLLESPATAAQVVPLLPTGPGSVVLITSRSPHVELVGRVGARALVVPPFDLPATTQLLAHHLHAPSPGLAARLHAHCAGIPLAVAVTAARAATGEDVVPDTTGDPAIRRRSQEDPMPDTPPAPVPTREAVREAIDALTPVARAVLLDLARVPGRFSPDLARAVTRLAPHALDLVIGVLAQANLLAPADDGHHRLHDVVTEVALAIGGPDADGVDDRVAAHRLAQLRALATLLMPARTLPPLGDTDLPAPDESATGALVPDDRAEALLWFDVEKPGLVATVRATAARGRHRAVVLMVHALRTALLLHKDHTAAAEVSALALSAARGLGDRDLLAGTLADAVRTAIKADALAGAQGLCDELAALADIDGGDLMRAKALKARAHLHLAQRRTAEADALFIQVADLHRGLGRPRARALALTELGTLRLDSGHAAEAIPPLTEAHTLLSEHPSDETYNRGRAGLALARAHQATGALRDALVLARAALSDMSAAGSPSGARLAQDLIDTLDTHRKSTQD
ncbi:tetratricopeptide repeat protein [Actinokineospora cianjurensis]|uniref:NB-ARC domain-containing protein n=1 Tax=Actinokineospora cianjurensis TaxID=585224 RepID=A0A421B2B9_9PSEU|nr:tetratricopeptide repeat protein [Actinokineospora cianjurensis]RLK58411.1 NB-ARC domain-containing protein [Actinokineospora cianjurensis]